MAARVLLPHPYKVLPAATWRGRRPDNGRRWAIAGVGALAFGALFASALPAEAQSAGPLVQITNGSPFNGCSADGIVKQEQSIGSTLYQNTAIEPWVAIDPSDTQRLLVGHQQDRWSDGGSRGLVGNVSSDGGSTWAVTIPSGVSECTGGQFVRASDPWVAFSPDGTAYFFSLTLDPSRAFQFGVTSGAMLVSRSIDHAQSWQAP